MRAASRSRQGGQVLILIFVGSLFMGGSAIGLTPMHGGKSIHDLQKETKALVPEADRRKRIEAVLDRWNDETKKEGRNRVELDKELSALLQRHDAPRSEFDRLNDKADANNAASRQALLDLRFKLAGELSADEWRALFAVTPVAR